jgi:ABC-type transporter Mla MlaB component
MPSVIGEFRRRARSYPAMEELRPPLGPRSIILDLRGPIARAAVPGVCERVRGLLAPGNVDLVTVEVGGLVRPDHVALDALARLQLTARRLGRSIRLRHAGAKLRDLLVLTGLAEELPQCPGLFGTRWQSEEREQAWFDEKVDPADPAV